MLGSKHCVGVHMQAQCGGRLAQLRIQPTVYTGEGTFRVKSIIHNLILMDKRERARESEERERERERERFHLIATSHIKLCDIRSHFPLLTAPFPTCIKILTPSPTYLYMSLKMLVLTCQRTNYACWLLGSELLNQWNLAARCLVGNTLGQRACLHGDQLSEARPHS